MKAAAARKKAKKVLLFMQLRWSRRGRTIVPAWWPRVDGKPAWVGVVADGLGWTIGDGDVMHEKDVGFAKGAMLDTYPEAKFKTRTAP